MTTHGDAYFWQRSPRWLNRLVAYSLAPAAVLALMVGALAYVAQQRAASLGAGEGYSLTMHVIAMVAIAALAVGVATALARLGRVELSALVLVAAAAGPMLVVATPVSGSVINAAATDTSAVWHALVAAGLTAVMAVWTALAVRCLAERDDATDVCAARSSAPWQWADLLFVAAAMGGVLVYMAMPLQANEPSVLAMAGWSAIAAGATVVAAYATSTRVLAGMVAASGFALVVVVLAYSRNGGWPGVAGWEGDLQSPIITSIASSVVLLSAPLVGYAIGTVTRAVVRQRSQGTSSEPALAAG